MNHFCIVDLSAFYFDVLKDRLYISAPKSQARRSAQMGTWRIGEALVRLLAPITSFTSEEIWQFLPKAEDRPESVHLAIFPASSDILGAGAKEHDEQQDKDWATLRSVRDEVLKALEEARNQKLIGTGLEAQVSIGSGNGSGGVHVEVRKADGLKCERCWNYSTRVGEDRNNPTVCERCAAVLKEIR